MPALDPNYYLDKGNRDLPHASTGFSFPAPDPTAAVAADANTIGSLIRWAMEQAIDVHLHEKIPYEEIEACADKILKWAIAANQKLAHLC